MSAPEDALAFQLRAVGIVFEREVVFAPPRKWRADFVIRGEMTARAPLGADLLVEIDGGTWTGGRHVTGAGHAADLEKLNEAVLMGYRVLRVTPAMVESGAALALIERALA